MIAFYAILTQIEITSSNCKLYFVCGNRTSHTATLTSGIYDSMVDVCTEIETQMNSICGHAYTFTCDLVWDDTYKCCKVKISQDTGTFDLTCTNTTDAIWDEIGFSTAANKTGAGTYTGDYQHQYGWYSDKPPALDSYDRTLIQGGEPFITENGKLYRITNPTNHQIRRINFSAIPEEKMWLVYATGNYTNQDLETCWLNIAGNNSTPFDLYSDFLIVDGGIFPGTTATLEGTYALLEPISDMGNEICSRASTPLSYYSINLLLAKDPT